LTEREGEGEEVREETEEKEGLRRGVPGAVSGHGRDEDGGEDDDLKQWVIRGEGGERRETCCEYLGKRDQRTERTLTKRRSISGSSFGRSCSRSEL
jgi:hypothetical protein